MPATTQSAPALVAGAQPQERAGNRVLLLRAICIGGQRVEAGAEIDVDRELASVLVSARKAERVSGASAPPAPAPVPPQPQVRARRARGEE